MPNGSHLCHTSRHVLKFMHTFVVIVMTGHSETGLLPSGGKRY